MAATLRLKAQQIGSLPDVMLSDGGNLYLRVRDDGRSRNFVFVDWTGDHQYLKGVAPD